MYMYIYIYIIKQWLLGEELIKSKKTTSFDLLTVFKGLL